MAKNVHDMAIFEIIMWQSLFGENVIEVQKMISLKIHRLPSPIMQHEHTFLPAKMFLNASSTFVESRADVSMKETAFFSESETQKHTSNNVHHAFLHWDVSKSKSRKTIQADDIIFLMWATYLRRHGPRLWARPAGGAGHSCCPPAWWRCCCRRGPSAPWASAPHSRRSGAWRCRTPAGPPPPPGSTWRRQNHPRLLTMSQMYSAFFF